MIFETNKTIPLVAALLLGLACNSWAEDTRQVGRYLDRSVLVHEAAQLNPLEQVARLKFSSRITVAEALRSALAGTSCSTPMPITTTPGRCSNPAWRYPTRTSRTSASTP